MIQRDKKLVFCHFLEFGLLDRVDIAKCDTAKSFFNTWQGYQVMIDHSKNQRIMQMMGNLKVLQVDLVPQDH